MKYFITIIIACKYNLAGVHLELLRNFYYVLTEDRFQANNHE